MKVLYHPLSWYVDKMKRREPFASLLYGDGEFMVAYKGRSGDTLQFGEVVTPRLESEMLASLDCDDPRIIRGSDACLLDWPHYKGGDFESVAAIGRRVDKLLAGRSLEWVDGTVWEVAVREGKLGSFFAALKDREVVLVCNATLEAALKKLGFTGFYYVVIPETNAYAFIDETEEVILLETEPRWQSDNALYLCCMGLGAIPLITRLLPILPTATFIDLGSTLDIFAGIGAQREWRAELYADPKAHQELIARNLTHES